MPCCGSNENENAGGDTSSETESDTDRLVLYINDGNGNFSKDNTAIPNIFESSQCVKSSDVDNDGMVATALRDLGGEIVDIQ